MCLRIKIVAVFIHLISLISSTASAQYSLFTGVGFSYSKLYINKYSSMYNRNWENVHLTNTSLAGSSIVIGIQKKITPKLNFQFAPRLQQWGGEILAEDGDPNFFLNLKIVYQSFRFPFMVDYTFCNKRLQLSSNVGAGIDYTYDLTFYPTNAYGRGRTQKRNVGMVNPYWLTGVCVSYQQHEKSKVSYQLSASIESDYLLRTNRFNDFGGYFNQEKIPLFSNIYNLCFLLHYRL